MLTIEKSEHEFFLTALLFKKTSVIIVALSRQTVSYHFVQQSLNSSSLQVQTLLALCGRFAMVESLTNFIKITELHRRVCFSPRDISYSY